MRDAVPLVEVTRSGVVERVHRGSIAAVQAGQMVYSVGDPQMVTPMRSTAKPFQGSALVKHGGVKAFDLSARELAVIASSHNGERAHVEAVRGLLAKADLDESALQCGRHPAYFPWITRAVFEETGSDVGPVHNNCSGKHAGMLLLARLLHVPVERYWDNEHPVQVEVVARVEEALGLPAGAARLGIDGCGVPTFNVSLTRLAEAYASLGEATASGEPDDLATIAKAWFAEPFMVGGTDRLDTDLMKLGLALGKVGSDGIYCLAVPSTGVGVAIKMESGSEEAAEAVAVEALVRFGVISSDELDRLKSYWRRPVLTFTGRVVGNYRAFF